MSQVAHSLIKKKSSRLRKILVLKKRSQKFPPRSRLAGRGGLEKKFEQI